MQKWPSIQKFSSVFTNRLFWKMNTYTTFPYKCEHCNKKSLTGEPRCNRYGLNNTSENFYVLPKIIVLTMCFLLSASDNELENYLENRQCGQEISEFDEEEHSILHKLSEKQLYEKIEILINHGVNFKVKVNSENIAHVAARKGDVALIHLIRDNFATTFKSPFYESNDCGETPLLVAILHQQHETIEVLMNHYLNPIGLETEGNSSTTQQNSTVYMLYGDLVATIAWMPNIYRKGPQPTASTLCIMQPKAISWR